MASQAYFCWAISPPVPQLNIKPFDTEQTALASNRHKCPTTYVEYKMHKSRHRTLHDLNSGKQRDSFGLQDKGPIHRPMTPTSKIVFHGRRDTPSRPCSDALRRAMVEKRRKVLACGSHDSMSHTVAINSTWQTTLGPEISLFGPVLGQLWSKVIVGRPSPGASISNLVDSHGGCHHSRSHPCRTEQQHKNPNVLSVMVHS